MKPILFNTEMVRAILDGRKTQTRRPVKPQPTKQYPLGWVISSTEPKNEGCFGWGLDELGGICCYAKPPYQKGDILYVRETWCELWHLDECDKVIDGTEAYYYRADGYNPTPFNHFPDENGFSDRDCPKWHPSIHMPKEAARIFLEVTDARAERVQDITEEGAKAEGFYYGYQSTETSAPAGTAKQAFMWTWQRLYDKGNYPWIINPWVWVIEFEVVKEV